MVALKRQSQQSTALEIHWDIASSVFGGVDVQLDPGQKRQEIDLLQVGVQFDMNI